MVISVTILFKSVNLILTIPEGLQVLKIQKLDRTCNPPGRIL